MEQTKQSLLDQLLNTVRPLSTDKLLEVLDFAAYLTTRPPASGSTVERGSAQAVLRHTGTFQFGSGELDQLLADIAQIRGLDMEGHA